MSGALIHCLQPVASLGSEYFAPCGIIQLPVMAQDVAEGVRQGEKQPGLTMVIPAAADRILISDL